MDDKAIRVLMVTTEYPPMKGGVGRYTADLTKSLQKMGLEVYVVCNDKGEGDYFGLSHYNVHNSDVLLKAVQDLNPNLVHIQNEPGLYGLSLNPIDPNRTTSNIDCFYSNSKIPIVTTFHSAYTFKQWINLASIIESTNAVKRYMQLMMSSWKHLLNYYSFHNLNRKKLVISKASIFFSHYLSALIGGDKNNHSCNVIYHGAEPSHQVSRSTKKEARSKFSLPQDRRIALALGFRTATKGWRILEKMRMPDDWIVVVNSSKNSYNKENLNLPFNSNRNKKTNNSSIIDLQRDFLDEADLSLLFYSADAILLPYTVCSSSGVMFDGLGHGLPFVASDLPFFREFSSKGLGVTVKNKPDAFADGLRTINNHYDIYIKRVNDFKKKLKWDVIATEHALLYERVLDAKKAIPLYSSSPKIAANSKLDQSI
jgi:glycosyltransferase involved in cell wall biosynthesis